jgi:hypothetical protein
MMGSSAGKTDDLLVLREVFCELLGSEGCTTVANVFRRDDSVVAAHQLILLLGLKGLMSVEVLLEVSMYHSCS